MKFILSTVFCVGSLIYIGSSFQVEPDRAKLFKNAIGSSVEYPIPKTTDDNVDAPMITVFDDDSYSPLTPFMSNIFRVNRSINDDRGNPKPLHESIKAGLKGRLSPTKRAVPRKTFYFDDNPSEYWFNNRIHSFGNTGFLGAFHAAVAPLATTIIDVLAYEKRDVRTTVGEFLRNKVVKKTKARVLDLCCGVGISTRALKATLSDAETVIGIDTSPEMIATARAWKRHETATKVVRDMFNQTKAFVTNYANKDSKKYDQEEMVVETNPSFARGNAERTIFSAKSFDLVTIMYGFHEIPLVGRYRILREVRRILKDNGTVAIVDICPEYEPSPSMLSGEPYVKEYQRNIHKQMKNVQGFVDFKYKVIVPGHVGLWLLTKKSSNTSSMSQDTSILSEKLPY